MMGEQAHADCKMLSNRQTERKRERVRERKIKRERGGEGSKRRTFLPFVYTLSRNFESYQRRQLQHGKGIRYHLIAKKKMTNAGS